MVINNFSGGLNDIINPRNLNKDMHVISTNVDITDTTLRPMRGLLPVDNPEDYGRYNILFRGMREIVSSDTAKTWVEYNGVLYSSDGTKMNAQGEVSTIGVNPPSLPPLVANEGEFTQEVEYVETFTFTAEQKEDYVNSLTRDMINDDTFDSFTISPIGLYDESAYDNDYEVTKVMIEDTMYRYVYTYYDSVSAYESAPSAVSVDVGYGAILGLQASTNPSIDTIRLYRSGTGITGFALVEELPNIDQSYNDTIDFTEIDGSPLTSEGNYPMPYTNFLVGAYGMLVSAGGSLVSFSDAGEYEYWSNFNTINIGFDITGIAVIQNGILVFTDHSTYIIVGTDNSNFSLYLLNDEFGCRNHWSIDYINNTVVWHSWQGICVTDGGNVRCITFDTIDYNFSTYLSMSINGTMFHNKYYLNMSDGKVLITSFNGNDAFTILDDNMDGVYNIDGMLIGINRDGVVGEVDKGELLTLHYLSPIFTAGQDTLNKFLNKFRIASDGVVYVKLYIDGVVRNNYTINKRYDERNIKLTDFHDVQVDIVTNGQVHEFSIPLRRT